MKKLILILALVGCQSPMAPEEVGCAQTGPTPYYIRLDHHRYAVSGDTNNGVSFSITGMTNIPGWQWAVSSRDTIITHQGENWDQSISWSSSIYEYNVNAFGPVDGPTLTRYMVHKEFKGMTDTVVAYSCMNHILIADTAFVVIY